MLQTVHGIVAPLADVPVAELALQIYLQAACCRFHCRCLVIRDHHRLAQTCTLSQQVHPFSAQLKIATQICPESNQLNFAETFDLLLCVVAHEATSKSVEQQGLCLVTTLDLTQDLQRLISEQLLATRPTETSSSVKIVAVTEHLAIWTAYRGPSGGKNAEFAAFRRAQSLKFCCNPYQSVQVWITETTQRPLPPQR